MTVLFSDIVGFTALSSSVATEGLFGMLNALYTAFDALVDTHAVHKIDTIGDGEGAAVVRERNDKERSSGGGGSDRD